MIHKVRIFFPRNVLKCVSRQISIISLKNINLVFLKMGTKCDKD